MNRSHSTPGLIESTGKIPLEEMQLEPLDCSKRDSPLSIFSDGDNMKSRHMYDGPPGSMTAPHITLGTATCSVASFVTDSSAGRKSTLPASPSYFKHSPTPSMIDENTADFAPTTMGQGSWIEYKFITFFPLHIKFTNFVCIWLSARCSYNMLFVTFIFKSYDTPQLGNNPSNRVRDSNESGNSTRQVFLPPHFVEVLIKNKFSGQSFRVREDWKSALNLHNFIVRRGLG